VEYDIRVEFFFIIPDNINKVMDSKIRGLSNTVPAGIDLDHLMDIIVFGVKVKEFKFKSL
jgi:hypothetical protein